MRDEDNFYAAPEANLGPDPEMRSQPGAVEGAPRTFGETFNVIIGLYSRAFAPMFAISALWGFINGVCSYLVETRIDSLLFEGEGALVLAISYFILFMGGMYFWIVGIKRIDNVYLDQPLGDEFALGVTKFFPVVVAYLLMGMISGFGLIFCIIPGIILGLLFFVSDVAVIIEDKGPIEGLQRSWNLVKGVENWFYAFGLLMVAFLMIGIPAGILGAVVAVITAADPVATNLLGGVITVLTFPLMLIVNYMIFQGLIARNEVVEYGAYGGTVEYDEPTGRGGDYEQW